MNYRNDMNDQELRRMRINQRFRKMFLVALIMGFIVGYIIGWLSATY